jgi:glutamate transport system permease protein
MTVLLSHLDEFAWGIVFTIGLVALGWIGAMVLGTVLAIMRVSPIRTVRMAATAYILVFRNVPIPVQMVLFVFGLPLLGIVLPLFPSAAIVLVT